MSAQNVGDDSADVVGQDQSKKYAPEPFVDFLINVAEPDEGEPEEVVINSFTGTDFLCSCHGTVTGSANQMVAFVYVKNVLAKNADISESDVLASPYYLDMHFQSLSSPVSWEINGQIPAAQGPKDNELDNTMRCLAVIYELDGSGMLVTAPNQTRRVRYLGQGVESCSEKAKAKAKPLAALSRSAAVASPPDRDPVERDGEWLLYRSLSVSEFGPGSRLMQHGAPLRGRTVAFAAANVNWRRGQRRITYINRAAGEPIIGTGFPVWFPGAPVSSVLVLQQSNLRQRSVIASECRDSPVILNLDGDEDIHVQVNFDFSDALSRAGGFDLWVRVID